MELDQIFAELGIYNGPWVVPRGGAGTAGNDDITKDGILNVLVNGMGGNDRITR